MRKFFIVVLLHVCFGTFSQTIKDKLSLAIKALEADAQCSHAIIGLHVIDDTTGDTIFNKNAAIGLAPASCQKIITSVTAFELLSKDFTYRTTLGYSGKINQGILDGDIIINGSGDPTLGSWRYQSTKENTVLGQFTGAIKAEGINEIAGSIIVNNDGWETQTIPGGWTWEDIGNYYGAGASVLNWRENQYDLILQSGNKTGAPVKIISTEPAFLQGVNLINEVTAANAGTGDNTIIYLASGSKEGYIRGTIPVNENHFIVSGSWPDGSSQLTATLSGLLNHDSARGNYNKLNPEIKTPVQLFFTHNSPSLDSINYWFLKKVSTFTEKP